MNLFIKEDTKYVFNHKWCQFYAEIDNSDPIYKKQPKARFHWDDGTETTVIYHKMTKVLTWVGDHIDNGELFWSGSAWIIRDYIPQFLDADGNPIYPN